jgi:hypothetical protein
VNVQSNRLRYLLTPTGIAEKTRLTYEFMEYSLQLYGQVRAHLRSVLEAAVRDNRRRIAIYGTGEAAELAYLSITELGLELVAVFDGPDASTFLGHQVKSIDTYPDVPFDLLIVASMEKGDASLNDLLARGIPREHMLTLRPAEKSDSQ